MSAGDSGWPAAPTHLRQLQGEHTGLLPGKARGDVPHSDAGRCLRVLLKQQPAHCHSKLEAEMVIDR